MSKIRMSDPMMAKWLDEVEAKLLSVPNGARLINVIRCEIFYGMTYEEFVDRPDSEWKRVQNCGPKTLALLRSIGTRIPTHAMAEVIIEGVQ